MTDHPINPAQQQPSSEARNPSNHVPPPIPIPPPMPNPYLLPTGGAAAVMMPNTSRGLYTAAAVINWVVLGLIIVSTFGIGIIAAAWFIPMTIKIHKYAKGPYKHTSLGVCTLLFCNLISGILMLVDDSNRPPQPTAAPQFQQNPLIQ